MKKISVLILALVIAFSTYAQDSNNALRTIKVTGIAEDEIKPDILYFIISLKEYKLNSGSKFLISGLEDQLIKAVENAGIDQENLKVENVYGYNYDWKEKNNKDFLAKKQFQLKLTDVDKLNQILSEIDPKGIEYARITQYTHSNINELNQNLQVEAVKNAKAKAEVLLEPLGEKLGKVIEMSENQRDFQPIYYKSVSNNRMLTASSENSSIISDLDFKNIKLKAEVHIVFSIQ